MPKKKEAAITEAVNVVSLEVWTVAQVLKKKKLLFNINVDAPL